MPRILSGDEISNLVKKVEQADSGEQRQPAGFDVSLSKVYFYSDSTYALSIQKTENSELLEVHASDGYFDLGAGAYLIELNEITTIPKDAIGILLPRSTLLRNGLDVRSALFDPGYSGQPKVMLVCHRPARIQKFARVGQLILLRSDGEFAKQYSGQYQGERGVK
ncbi:MAG: dCTP deaminase domain-containing protein [Nitrososphaerales archaeon]